MKNRIAPEAVAGAFAFAVGAAGLAGWAFGVEALKSWDPGLASMKPNGAVCIMLTGAAVALCRRESRRSAGIVRAASAAALAIAVATLAQYAFRADFGIDQLIFREIPAARHAPFPGRMAIATALNFVALAAATLLMGRGRRAGQWAAGLSMVAAFLAVSSWVLLLYGFTGGRGFVPYSPMPINTAAAFIALSAGVVAALPDFGLRALWRSETLGGRIFRRWSAPAVVLPVFLGWMTIRGVAAGLFRDDEGHAVLMLAFGAAVASMLYLLARSLATLESELKSAGAYNRSLIEASLDSLVTIGPDGKILDVNAATEKITGRARGGLIGTDFCAYFTDPERARAGYEAVFREESVRDYALEVRRPDGGTTPVLYNAAVFKDEAGKVAGVFAAARDVTELRRAEDARRAGEKILRTLAENLPQKIAIKDRELKYSFANANFAADLRVAPEALVGKTDLDFFPRELAEKYRADDARVMAAGRAVELEEAYRHDGETAFVNTVKVPLREQGSGVTGELVIFWDITEKKRAEQELRRLNAELEDRVAKRTEELSRSNKELEAFAYSVSHDLRAPLRAADGFSKILLDDYGPKMEPECRRYLGLVRESAQQMGRLIDDLLSFSRLGRQGMTPQPLEMDGVVAEALEALAREREGRAVDLRVGALPPCRGDRALLRQVWINLIGNALKFTRGRAPAVIEIGAGVEDGRTSYFVKDNGAGFDMRYVDKLFKVFQRLHAAEQFEGTGVGLAIVARLVERHGGRVWARGDVGRGAEFRFTIGGQDDGRKNGGDPAGRGQPEGRGADPAQPAQAPGGQPGARGA